MVYGRHRLVLTNTTPTTAYRGAARPNVAYLVERLVEAAPTHVEGVRRYLIDITSPEDLAVIERVFGAVAESICGERPWIPTGPCRCSPA